MDRKITQVFFEAIKNGAKPKDCTAPILRVMPKKLFKYFRPDNHALNSLKEQYLWHSAPNQFNDPYDSQLGWIGDMAIGDDPFFNVVNKNFSENLKICSLCEKNDSLLMWGHYASKHTGFCLEYDFTNSSWEPFPMQLYPVHYTNEILDMKLCYDSGLNLYNIAILASISKHKDWEYEQEWRLFMWDSIINNSIPSPLPTGIYFGAKSNPKDEIIKHAMEFALSKHITQYRMELALDKFELRAQVFSV